MEAIIKVTPEELTQNLLERIRQLIGTGAGYEIELHLRSTDESFQKKLQESIKEAEDGKIVRFTPDELEAYTRNRLG